MQKLVKAQKSIIPKPDNTIDEVKRVIGDNTVTYKVDSDTHTPTSISALILSHIKGYVEEHCKQEVSSCSNISTRKLWK